MNGKERVHAALRWEPVDRVPVFMWFHPQTAQRLARLLEIPAPGLGEAMGDDVGQPWVNNNYAMEGIVHEQEGEGHIDFRGVEWTKEEVRRATAHLIEGTTSDGGGYIVAASHIIPPQTRDDNIFHMYAEAGISREAIFDRAAHIRGSLAKERNLDEQGGGRRPVA